MNNSEFKSKTNYLALTIKRENKLMAIKNIAKTTTRISLKIILYAMFLTVANIII